MPICVECVEYLKLDGSEGEARIITMNVGTCDFCLRDKQPCASSRDYGYPSLPKTALNPPLNVVGWYEGQSKYTYFSEPHDGHRNPKLTVQILDAGAGNYIQIKAKGLAFDNHKEVDAFAEFLKSFLPAPIKHPD